MEDFVKILEEMGYEREKASKALIESGNNFEAAIDILSGTQEHYKQVFLVRTDLNMGIGKIAAQVGHATLGAYKKSPQSLLDKWEESGQAKIVLRIENLERMMLLEQLAQSFGITTYVVQDAGHTQIDPGTVTVCAIGPDLESKINQVTGTLKLL